MVNSLIDIVFDGVLDKEEIAKRFYEDAWTSTCINTSNLVNPPEFIKKILDFEKAKFEVCNDGEGLFGITISKKSDWIRVTVNFYRTNLNPCNIMDFIMNCVTSNELAYFDYIGVNQKRTYEYDIYNEKQAKRANTALKNHIQWFNDNCSFIYNMLRQMDLDTISKNVSTLDEEIEKAQSKRADYVRKMTISITNICEAYKDTN